MKKLDELYRSGKRPIYGINAEGRQEVIREETFQIYEPLLTVTGSVRFLYYLADWVFCLLLWWIFTFAAYFIYYRTGGVVGEQNSNLLVFAFYVFHVFYYAFFESIFQQTPGKMLAKVKVVDEYGGKPKFTTILLRSLCRCVPFDNFSCLGEYSRGWHDSLSNTYVMKKELLNERLRDLDDGALNYDSLIINEDQSI
jgi:uncharacterized RDD family membrane protein YckC